MAAGRNPVPSSGRFVSGSLPRGLPPWDCGGLSSRQLRQPAQRSPPRGEAVLAAAGDHEWRQALQPAPNRPLRDGERAGTIVWPDERVLLGRGTDEDAVVQPLRLDELELAFQVRAGEDEDDAPVDAIVLEHALGQHRAVARPAPDHAVQTDVDTPLVVE